MNNGAIAVGCGPLGYDVAVPQADAVKNALTALGVTQMTYKAGSARVKGDVEDVNKLVEAQFESRLRVEPGAGVAT